MNTIYRCFLILGFVSLCFSCIPTKDNIVLNWYFPKCELSRDANKCNNGLLHEETDAVSRILTVLKEPPVFCSVCDNNKEIYRFLWIRYLRNTVCIRLVIDADSSGMLYVKKTDNTGEEEPREINSSYAKTVSPEEINRFYEIILKSEFWEMSKKVILPVEYLDGEVWLLEGVRKGKYHYVYRMVPRDPDFRRAALYLVEISGLQVDRKGDIRLP